MYDSIIATVINTALLITCMLPVIAEVHGYRGDGTAYHPDASIPLTWSETENIAWKTKLPNWGNSVPVIGGDNVYVMVEPDIDMPAPQLIAINRGTGAIAWRADLDVFDALGKQDLGKEYFELRCKAWHGVDLALQLESLLARQSKGEGVESEIAKVHEMAGAKGISLQSKPGAGKKVRVGFNKKDIGKRLRDANINQLRWEICPTGTVEIKPQNRTWCANWSGTTWCAPVTDANAVYVVTGRNLAVSFTHEGTRRWRTCLPVRDGELTQSGGIHWFGNAPILCQGNMLVSSGQTVYALDPESGKLLWSVPFSAKKRKVDGRNWSTIVPFKLAGKTFGLLQYDKLYLFDPLTGKDLLADHDIGEVHRGPPGICGDTVYLMSNQGGRGISAVQLRMVNDVVQVTELWNNGKKEKWEKGSGLFITAAPNILIAGGVFNPATGKFRGRVWGKKGVKSKYGLSGFTAKDHFYIPDAVGMVNVYETTTLKRVATNILKLPKHSSEEGRAQVRRQSGNNSYYFFSLASPAVHQDSIYIRSMEHLYRIKSANGH